MPRSSRGLGRWPLTPVTRVRIPYAVPRTAPARAGAVRVPAPSSASTTSRSRRRAGCEEQARAFYGGLLGLPEIEKPAALAARGGCWFACGHAAAPRRRQRPVRAATKAHPALAVRDAEALAVLLARLGAAGCETRRDVELPGLARGFVDDPFGNRIELVALARVDAPVRVSSARCRISPTPRASSPAPRSTSTSIRRTPSSACATRSPRARRPRSALERMAELATMLMAEHRAQRARRAAGHGRLGQGRHRQALPRRPQPDERARRRLQGADLDRARPRLPLAHPPGAPAARRDRHLQPLALRGRARRARRGARAEAGLEEALRGHQRVRGAPRERGHDRRQAVPAHLAGGAGEALPRAHRGPHEELEVLARRPRQARRSGTST